MKRFNKQKQFLSLVLALVMVTGLLAPCAYAFEEPSSSETTEQTTTPSPDAFSDASNESGEEQNPSFQPQEDADKTALAEVISAASSAVEVAGGEDACDEAILHELTEALTIAQEVYANEQTTQDDADTAADRLSAALDSFLNALESAAKDQDPVQQDTETDSGSGEDSGPDAADNVPTDPGLPNVEVGEGMDTYTQDLMSPAEGWDVVTVGEDWGLSGQALEIQAAASDIRVKFLDLDELAAGSYEVAFRTGDSLIGNIGFLARYVDESKYGGLSIDSSATWALHAATGLTTRQNTNFPQQGPTLETNTSYQVRIEYSEKNITVKYMKEGDAGYTDLGTQVMTTGTSEDAGKFAIRMNRGSLAGATITVDNIKQYNADGELVKTLDFEGELPTYEVRQNKNNTLQPNYATLTLVDMPESEMVPGFSEGKASKFTTAGVFVDAASPMTANGTYTVQLSALAAGGGLVFNYTDENNYATIEYTDSGWIAGGKNNGTAVSLPLSSVPAPDGSTHTYRLAHTESGYTLTVSGAALESAVTYNLGELTGLYTGKGRVGVVNGAGVLYAGPFELVYAIERVDISDPEDAITIESDEMKVAAGASFPHIYSYKDTDGNTLAYGAIGEASSDMVINGITCTTTSEKVAQTAGSITYKVTASGEGLAAEFTVKLTVEGKTLRMEIPTVTATEGTVQTFAFADGRMISLAGMGAGAAMGHFDGWGPARDTFLTAKSGSAKPVTNVTYALLYDTAGGSVAAIENNTESSEDKYTIALVTSGDTPYISVANKSWAWQYYDNSEPETAWAEVIIGGDENGDGQITWQDAGITYRDIMTKPYGWENVKNEWMYIAMNMSSQASQPFLRVLDNAKAISYQTDGFGFKIMNKGYQGAGHDDSHGDYAFVGEQQGGVKDFNYLINEGLKYGIKNGIHINMTEFSLDSRAATENNLLNYGTTGLRPNWNWFDQAYLIDKTADVSQGTLEQRLDALKEAVPNLDFIYVDVYQSGSNYNSTQALKYMNENGWTVGSEALGDFNQGLTFVHWNTDMYYPCGGTQSEVLRFVNHGVADLSAPDRALLGSLMPGVADWRNTNIFNDAQITFYRENLPTKYLQYFDLLEWTPNEHAKFSGNVESSVETANGQTITTITKDGKTIAEINTGAIYFLEDYTGKTPARPSSAEIFIPWSPVAEDKIYCYSDTGNRKTWQVPNSWSGVTEAYLYKLTNSGRTEMQTVPVSSGSVVLSLTAGQPYVLVKTQSERVHRYDASGAVTDTYLPTLTEKPWGEGSPIANFGFTGKTLEGWTTSGDVSIDTTLSGSNNGVPNSAETDSGDPRVKFGSGAASISQNVTVEAGATYSFSAWVNSEGARPITLTVTAGNTTDELTLDTTAGIPLRMKPSKYIGRNYQRLEVEITIPDGVTSAVLTLSAADESTPAYADDFRCWKWNGSKPENSANYYYYEDFENLDENWGPFASTVGSQPYTNLAYHFEDDSQLKWYTIDGGVSLKFAQPDGFTGTLARTLPSTLKFKTGDTYQVEVDYQTYRELRKKNSGADSVDLSGNIVSNQYFGYNYPLASEAYTLTVRKADGTQIAQYPFEPSTFAEGTDLSGFSLNARPSTKTLSFQVDASMEEGIYLTVDYIGEADRTPILVIDNFRVTEVNGNQVELAEAWLTEEVIKKENAALDSVTGDLNLPTSAPSGATIAWSSSDETVVGTTGTVVRPEANHVTVTLTATISASGEESRTKTFTVTVTATSSPEPSPNPGGSTTKPTTPSVDVSTGGNGETTVIANKLPVTVKDGTAQAVIPNNMVSEIVNQAEKHDSSTVVIAPQIPSDVAHTEVTIPASAVSGISKNTNADLRIETPVSNVTIPNDALSSINGSLIVSTKNTGDAVEISIQAGGQPVNQVPGGIKAEIPVECGPGAVAMLVNADGEVISTVRKSIGNGQTMTVPLDGSARVIIVDNAKKFSDLSASNWAADAVAFASSHELMNGVSDSNFSPTEPMTRGMMAMVLHNLENNPGASYSGSFTDVNNGAWYAEAVQWAADQDIIAGLSDGSFAPDEAVTREQLAVMLYRYAGKPDVSEGAMNRFTDSGSVSDWAGDAVNWAVSVGIINGYDGRLNPQGDATRAEIAQMLMNFVSSQVL